MAGTRKPIKDEEEIKAWLLRVAETANRFADGIDPKRSPTRLPELKRLVVQKLDAIGKAAHYAHTLLTMEDGR